MSSEEGEESSRCPLCPETGPPSPSKHEAATVQPEDAAPASPSGAETSGPSVAGREEFNHVWIACTKCHAWNHAACVLLSGEEWESTVPQEVRDEMREVYPDQGVWFDWAQWVEKWYCRPCLDHAMDPTNPRPPRRPLFATTSTAYTRYKHGQNGQSKRSARTKVDGEPAWKRARNGSSRPESVVDGGDDAQAEPVTTPVNGSRPKRRAAENAPDYYAWNHGISAPTTKWLQLIADPEKYGKVILDADYPSISGSTLTKAWLDSDPGSSRNGEPSPSLFHGPNRRPVVIRPSDGGFESLGGSLPPKSFQVSDVAEQVGRNVSVDVIDVATQQSSQWNLGKWADYFVKASDPSYTGKVYNVISLEITGSPLSKKVRAPSIVREIDWVDNCWNFPPGWKAGLRAEEWQALHGTTEGDKDNTPGEDVKMEEVEVETAKEKVDGGQSNGKTADGKKVRIPTAWPKVQLYCLMGIRGSWTDWHVDFAASSVYYTIHTGAKEFFFIEPTEKNLKAYAEWSGSHELQQDTWLGDMCEGGVRRARLEAGDTMIIPSGYIHAVYTPRNTIVFGGNFLHSYSIPTQLRLRQIEIDTKVPQRFRFPFFDKLCWYVAEKQCAELRHLRAYRTKVPAVPPSPPARVVLEGLLDLAKFLRGQADVFEEPTNEPKRRKVIYDRVPHEKVLDPSGLARELEWRVKRELGIEDSPAASSSGLALPMPAKGKGTERLKSRTLDSRRLPKGSRTDMNEGPWHVTEQSDRSAFTVEQVRPRKGSAIEDDTDVATKAEKAQVSLEVIKQKRSRMRNLPDGGLVLEEQKEEFTQRVTTWSAPLEP